MFRTIRKRPAGQRQRAQSPSEEDEEDAPGHTGATTATELNKAAKRMRRGGAPSTGDKRDEVLPVVVAFGASGTAASLSSDMATRRLDVDGITEGDEASPKTQKDSSQILSGEEAERAAAAGEYQGLASYNQYVNTKKDHVKGIRVGPIRSATYVRMNSRFDYQPDICKDYKETGFCGYGDSCKFMHDRGDYKAGWQIDKDWDAEQEKKKSEELALAKALEIGPLDGTDVQEIEVDKDADLATACPICHRNFVDPVTTKCGHFFSTLGVFNAAKDLKARLAKRQARLEEVERVAREAAEKLQKEQDDRQGNESE